MGRRVEIHQMRTQEQVNAAFSLASGCVLSDFASEFRPGASARRFTKLQRKLMLIRFSSPMRPPVAEELPLQTKEFALTVR